MTMFGTMNVVQVLDLRNAPNEVGSCSTEAVAQLLAATDHAKIERWIQFPRALFVFLMMPGDAESGAFYVYDRQSKVWFSVDFDDDKFGGYAAGDFDQLVRECRFLDVVERPHLMTGGNQWIIAPGVSPRLRNEVGPGSADKAA
jgi:hypothetical protein